MNNAQGWNSLAPQHDIMVPVPIKMQPSLGILDPNNMQINNSSQHPNVVMHSSAQNPHPNISMHTNPQTPHPNMLMHTNPQIPHTNIAMHTNLQTPLPNIVMHTSPQTPQVSCVNDIKKVLLINYIIICGL